MTSITAMLSTLTGFAVALRAGGFDRYGVPRFVGAVLGLALAAAEFELAVSALPGAVDPRHRRRAAPAHLHLGHASQSKRSAGRSVKWLNVAA